MGVLARAGWRALRRRLSPYPSVAWVRDALCGETGIGVVEAVEVRAAEGGGALVCVSLRAAEGMDARTAACRATEVLHKRLPDAEICIDVFTPERVRAA